MLLVQCLVQFRSRGGDLLVGEHDRTTTPRAARVLHEGIPGSEHAELPNAGHMSMIEAQDAYLGHVRDFLRRIN